MGAPVRVSHRYRLNIPPAVAIVFPSGLNAVTPVTNCGTGNTGPGPPATDQRYTESPQPFTAKRRRSGLATIRSVARPRVPGRITGSASRYERSAKRPLSAVESRPSSPTKNDLLLKSMPRPNSESFLPVFIDQTMVENMFVVASIVPRLLKTICRGCVYEFGDGRGVQPGASGRGGIFASSFALSALSLSGSENTLFPSRGRQTRTKRSLPPAASRVPSSEKVIGR